jgi:hypothetical protein
MGINDLRLTSELIATLYPDCLIQENEPVILIDKVSKFKPVAETAYPFLGENNRSICFLANYSGGDFLPADQLLFLQKILAACKYDLNDIALVNIAHLPFDFADLRIRFSPRIIFLWGVAPEHVGLMSGLADFNVTLLDGISVIRISDPHIMSGVSPEGTALKQRLWACLKKIFNL